MPARCSGAVTNWIPVLRTLGVIEAVPRLSHPGEHPAHAGSGPFSHHYLQGRGRWRTPRNTGNSAVTSLGSPAAHARNGAPRARRLLPVRTTAIPRARPCVRLALRRERAARRCAASRPLRGGRPQSSRQDLRRTVASERAREDVNGPSLDGPCLRDGVQGRYECAPRGAACAHAAPRQPGCSRAPQESALSRRRACAARTRRAARPGPAARLKRCRPAAAPTPCPRSAQSHYRARLPPHEPTAGPYTGQDDLRPGQHCAWHPERAAHVKHAATAASSLETDNGTDRESKEAQSSHGTPMTDRPDFPARRRQSYARRRRRASRSGEQFESRALPL